MDIKNIPTAELEQDLQDSQNDISACELALSLGINSYGDGKGARNVKYRLEENKRFVKITTKELKRRKKGNRCQ